MPFALATHTAWEGLAKLLGWNRNEALDRSIHDCRAQSARRIPSNQASLIGVGNGSYVVACRLAYQRLPPPPPPPPRRSSRGRASFTVTERPAIS